MLVFSASAVQAGDVNATDADAADSSDDVLEIVNNDSVDETADESLIGNCNASFERNQSKLTSPTAKVYCGGNYQVTLSDSNASAPLANKRVYFSIGNAAYSAITNSKGVASLKLNLNPGTYLINSYFTGDDSHDASNNLSCKVNVLTTIKAGDITKYYKGAKAYKATFLDSQGNALKNKKVTITVKGKKYAKKTDKNGSASLPVKLRPGTYKITAANPVTGYAITTTFKILSTVSASSIKKVKGDSKKFTAKFYKSSGKVLAKKYVKVKIRGKSYWYQTNSKGKVILPFNNYKTGTYKVVCYSGDGLSKSATVQIFSKATTRLSLGFYTFVPNDNKSIKIRFTTNLDDNSKSGKTVKISIGGKGYYKKTNANGEIDFKLPNLNPNVYHVECYFMSDKFFKSAHADNYVTVLSTSNTDLTVASGTSFGYGAGTPFNVIYTAGGVPLIKRTVTFTIDGRNYAATTDYYGTASIPINIGIGNYTVSYRTSDEANLKGSFGDCDITVFERNDTILTCEYKSSYYDYSQMFRVRMTDSNATPIAFESVTLTIGGERFTEVTDANGYAIFSLNVALGSYKFSAAYKGSNSNKPASATFATTIQLSKYGKGLNEKNSVASDDYLLATKNCQVNNAKIKKMAKSLTKGLKSDLDKAKAIFNYVRDYVYYQYYYDTHKGAVRTLTSGAGNCVDQSHLLVALYRAAGLKARYIHGTCQFYDDGQFSGHVWTQVLIGRTWICGDAMDYSNYLGKINNWNTKNYKIKNKFWSLPF